MIRIAKILSLVPLLLPVAGCPDLSGLLTPSTTTIELVNPGNLAVEVTLYIGESQYTTKELLRLGGEEIERTVAAGQTVTISRDCDDLQAVFIDNAKASIVVFGPEDESDVLRDGSDFGCGDTIRFTFSYTLFPRDMDIGVSYPGS